MFTHSEYKIDIIKENQTNKNEEIILYMYIDVAIIEKLNYNKKKKEGPNWIKRMASMVMSYTEIDNRFVVGLWGGGATNMYSQFQKDDKNLILMKQI